MTKITHAAIPGTGPAGETCFTCGHAATTAPSGKKPVPVCRKAAELVGRSILKSGRIREMDRACRYWTRRDPK